MIGSLFALTNLALLRHCRFEMPQPFVVVRSGKETFMAVTKLGSVY